MICKRCGKMLKSKSLKCGSCGEKHFDAECSGMNFVDGKKPSAPVEYAESLMAKKEESDNTKRNLTIIAGIVAIVMSLTVVLGIKIVKNKTDNFEKPVEIIKSEYKNMAVKFATIGELEDELCVVDEESAKRVLDVVSGIYGYDNVDSQLQYTGQPFITDIAEHYIFEQKHNGKSVYGKSMIITVSAGKVVCVSGNYQCIDTNVETGNYTCEAAVKKAEKALNGKAVGEPKNIILCADKAVDAWCIRIDGEHGETEVFVDTATGEFVLEKEAYIVADPDMQLAKRALDAADANGEYGAYTEIESDQMAILNPMEENIPFRAKIVSNVLYKMNHDIEDDELKGKVQNVWSKAVYLLPAEADFIDCVTAADVLADRGMLEQEERKEMLNILDGYNKSPEPKIEVAGTNPRLIVCDINGEEYYNYSYKLFRSDSEFNCQGDVIAEGVGTQDGTYISLEKGGIYCLVITEMGNNNIEEERKEYIYCAGDIGTNYQLYTQFNKWNRR